MNTKNNFDFLRFLFAIFVIITHSYPLSGSTDSDVLSRLTNGNMVFSDLGVKGFFIISGYLIYQSLRRSKNIIDYYWKRFLRLFPGLLFVLLLTVALASIIYDGKTNYIENKSVYSYLYRNLSLFKLQYSISGVFDKNTYGNAINGSLWTICYEFTMYILLSFLFLFKSNTKIIKYVLSLLFVGFWIYFFEFKNYFDFTFFDLSTSLLSDVGIFFVAGALLAVFEFEKFKYINSAILISVILLIGNEIFISNYNCIRILFFPILVISIGLKSNEHIIYLIQKTGDLSYGIYIYSFPVQQTLMHFFKLNALLLMIITLPISMFFAYFSWHFVEKKALSFKNKNPILLVINKFRSIKLQEELKKC